MNINVLLSGRLKVDGYGQGKPENGDGTFRLTLPEGSTIQEVIRGMDVPPARVAMTMINGRKHVVTDQVEPEDRVLLIPSDVATLWRHLGLMNVGMESVCDF
jgi:uncharacterized protein YlzI (FlbEa/FlbD family)